MVLILVSIFNINFFLNLSINDQMVGYVSEEKDYNEAKRMLQSRMVSVDGTKWSDNTKYTLAVVRDSDMTETYRMQITFFWFRRDITRVGFCGRCISRHTIQRRYTQK